MPDPIGHLPLATLSIHHDRALQQTIVQHFKLLSLLVLRQGQRLKVRIISKFHPTPSVAPSDGQAIQIAAPGDKLQVQMRRRPFFVIRLLSTLYEIIRGKKRTRMISYFLDY